MPVNPVLYMSRVEFITGGNKRWGYETVCTLIQLCGESMIRLEGWKRINEVLIYKICFVF